MSTDGLGTATVGPPVWVEDARQRTDGVRTSSFDERNHEAEINIVVAYNDRVHGLGAHIWHTLT